MDKKPGLQEDKAEKTPVAHDAPGLSPLERMTEFTRHILRVPAKELARMKRQDEKKRR